ncbi:hypothetical protein SERLADRAFT_397100 [Serpula lacrymans var. lacrymans S7.9]|nr:uncharacterized protein SERLADRAFT_397100 [Serpula lacrymans var. lacrymans S7.9]EGO21759.1 hypothetical protein SERLADRAFT_397100 [Serpula lacrymans var. lacrymans S7.9]
MLDWDSNIVFTKRTLVEFLKYTGTTVDPSFSNIQKLPRYAQFGKLSPSDQQATNTGAPEATQFDSGFSPSTSQSQITGQSITPAVSQQSVAEQGGVVGEENKPSRRVRTQPGGASSVGNLWDMDEQEQFIPTRRVRQRPGGQDNIDSLF